MVYFRLSIEERTSFLFGITLKASFRVVMMEAAALAKVRSSVRFSSFRSSRPCSSTQLMAQAQKVSPAPVVSMVLSQMKGRA